MTASVIAQVVMVLTLLLMITGKTPIYMTAIVGATLSALIAGFPIMGSAEMTIAKMVNTGLNPVIADMTGILLFIGIMQAPASLTLSFATSCASATSSAAAPAFAPPAVSLQV